MSQEQTSYYWFLLGWAELFARQNDGHGLADVCTLRVAHPGECWVVDAQHTSQRSYSSVANEQWLQTTERRRSKDGTRRTPCGWSPWRQFAQPTDLPGVDPESVSCHDSKRQFSPHQLDVFSPKAQFPLNAHATQRTQRKNRRRFDLFLRWVRYVACVPGVRCVRGILAWARFFRFWGGCLLCVAFCDFCCLLMILSHTACDFGSAISVHFIVVSDFGR